MRQIAIVREGILLRAWFRQLIDIIECCALLKAETISYQFKMQSTPNMLTKVPHTHELILKMLIAAYSLSLNPREQRA